MKEVTIKLSSDFPFWWRFNIYMSAVCYGQDGHMVEYCNLIDSVYDIQTDSETRLCPLDYDTNREIKLQTPPCDKVKLYLYIIANTFPQSRIIRDSPPFDARLMMSVGEEILTDQIIKVDQLGGHTIAGSEFSI